MLHVLNLAAVLLLPVLASTFPQNSRWRDLYDKRMQTGYPTPPNPLEVRGYVCCNQPPTPPGGRWPPRPPHRRRLRRPLYAQTMEKKDDRSGPLRRALQELTLLQHQQNAAQDAQLLPAAEVPALLPPGTGFGGLYAKKREELLARLLGGRSAVLPVPLHELQGASSEGDLLLEDAQKRGGFVVRRNNQGAPGSPGGPNIGDCPSNCRTCYRFLHQGKDRWRCFK